MTYILKITSIDKDDFMRIYIKSAKEMSRGVFWIVDDELLAFPFMEKFLEGVAKSGNTYNHKKL